MKESKKTKKVTSEIEDGAFFSEDFNEQPPSDIVAYNELRSCADLFRMFEHGQLVIQPDFQRDVVWASTQQTRFIDSLLKQLPIPSLCFSLDYKSQKWMVIDGLQRISSIIRFLSNKEWRLSNLEDIDPVIAGATNIELKTDLVLYSRLANLTIPITILRCDLSKKSHSSYLFTIFHRLNTGGLKLNNQEIRNAIYAGNFNDLLKSCNKNPSWQNLMGIKNRTYRYKKEELILRFFALHFNLDKYNGKLAKFLNDFMDDHKNLSLKKINDWTKLFERTITLIHTSLGEGSPLQKEPNAVSEALFIGVSHNLDFLETQGKGYIKKNFDKLKSRPNFSEENLQSDLSNKNKVQSRLATAIAEFGA